MIVYVDVLIVLNLFVNFFILKLTAHICKDGYKTFRIISGSLVGALFSLYIFLPSSHTVVEVAFRLAMSGVITVISFGFDTLKSLIRRISVFFAASFIYAGCMLGVWYLFKPNRLAINNGIVYVDISPLVLIVATVVSYLVLSVIRFFSVKQAFSGKRCKLIIIKGERKIDVTALVDTGHSLSDSLSDRPVIIIDTPTATKLFDTVPTLEAVSKGGDVIKGFRMIPYSSVGGHGLLPAFEPDILKAEIDNKSIEINRPLLAISKEPLGEDYRAIISPDSLNIN